MRNLMLVAVILQLVITVDIYGFQFGDIIAFKPKCAIGDKFEYQHFAVYVGDKQLPGKKPGDDIFERLKGTPPKCGFSKLDMTKEPVDANYLDGYKDPNTKKEHSAGNPAEIEARINKKYNNCGAYLIAHNNCEHLATYVRYGVKVALQFELSGEGLCYSKINKQDLLKYLREKKVESTCPADPGSSMG